ncbi:MAG: hypothetical protein Q9226_004170 [Calogaya cf. arnoldii]
MLFYPRGHNEGEKAINEDKSWKWQLGALLTCIFSLLVIIVIACTSHGKTLNGLLPLGITLNAAISIFATILKTTMLYCAAEAINQSKWIWFYRQPHRLSDVELYDQASRGPWGALAMLWHVRWKDLSSLAAIIIIYSLAIDPFAQQLTHLELETVETLSSATANVQWVLLEKSFWGIQGAYVSAFFTGAARETDSECRSGNCTWSPYQSLAVCDQCLDISDQIRVNETCIYIDDALCAAYLPNGLMLEFPLYQAERPMNDSFSWSLSGIQDNNTAMNTTTSGSLLGIKDVGLSLVNFTKITRLNNYFPPVDDEYPRLDNCDESGDNYDVPRCIQKLREKFTASECTLYWCINRYSARQELGTFHEDYIDSWRSQYGPDIGFVDYPRVSTVYHENDREPFIRLIPSLDDGNVTVLHRNANQSNTDYPDAHVTTALMASYSPCYVARRLHQGLSRSFAEFFTTSLDANRTGIESLPLGWKHLPFRPDASVVLYGMNMTGRQDSFSEDAVFDVFSDVAYGITQYIRNGQRSPDIDQDLLVRDPRGVELSKPRPPAKFEGNLQAIGKTFEDRTVVRIRWSWLAFPIGLVAMTCFLTIATKLRSSRQEIPPWGSSMTALMIRGPYSHTEGPSPLIRSTKQMQDKAKSTKIAFGKDANGYWRLSEQDESGSLSQSTEIESMVSVVPLLTTHETIEPSNSKGASFSSIRTTPTVSEGEQRNRDSESPHPSKFTFSAVPQNPPCPLTYQQSAVNSRPIGGLPRLHNSTRAQQFLERQQYTDPSTNVSPI